MNEADEYSRLDDDDEPPIELAAGAEAHGERLDKWLASRLPDYSRSRLQRWIVEGRVSRAGRVVATRDAVYDGDVVTVVPRATDDESAFRPEPVPLDIVYEDDALIVLDKRAGLVVHPAAGNWSGTVLNGLLHHAPALAGVPRAGIVHRLDKDTSGLMVVAKTLVAQTDLVRQLQARTVGRTYVALVAGTPPASGTVALAIGRDARDRTRMAAARGPTPSGYKAAVTHYETLASVTLGRQRSVSCVRCRLETGRTHQIRVHMQAIGHPLVGDATYGGGKTLVPFGRQALHAWRLALQHPVTHDARRWIAKPPDDLETLAGGLGFDLTRLLATADA